MRESYQKERERRIDLEKNIEEVRAHNEQLKMDIEKTREIMMNRGQNNDRVGELERRVKEIEDQKKRESFKMKQKLREINEENLLLRENEKLRAGYATQSIYK